MIAVVDSGVDLTHPDLIGNLWANPGETAGNGLDDDANGKVDDLHGYDFVDADADPDDFHFHGTHVAGIAAAVAGNAEGAAGVAPEARLMALRALDGNGSGSTSDIADAVRYAALEGAQVINLSLAGLAGGSGDPVFFQAVQVAQAADAVVVAAAGNAGSNNDSTATVPCTLAASNLICVAALDPSGALAVYSNYGLTTVDVGAPGTAILSSKTDWGARRSARTSTWASAPGRTSRNERMGGGDAGRGRAGKAATESPAGPYVPNADARLTKASPLALTDAAAGCTST